MPLSGWAVVIAILAAASMGYVLGRRRAMSPSSGSPTERREDAYIRLLECVAVASNEAATLDEAMRESIERICLAMGWPVARIHSVAAEGSLQPTVEAFEHGMGVASGDAGQLLDVVLPTGERIVERAQVSGHPEAIYDLAAAVDDRALGARRDDRRLRSIVAVPVLTHGRVSAVLEFGSAERVEPDDHLLDALSVIGVQIGRVAERAMVEQKLRQMQKLEAIGRLSAGMAHEINNPLAFAYSNLNQLLSEWEKIRTQVESADPDEAMMEAVESCDELVGDIREGVERAVSIVRDMTSFARVGEHRRTPTDLRDVVDSAIRMASTRQEHGVELHCQHAKDLPRVSCVATQLNQVFVNLIANALEAASPDGWVGVSTHQESEYVVVEVEDTGCGMSPETQDRIFDPFFTTKQAGEGMGLGLAISYEIVRNHGGEIRVISAVDAGTVIEVCLPI